MLTKLQEDSIPDEVYFNFVEHFYTPAGLVPPQWQLNTPGEDEETTKYGSV